MLRFRTLVVLFAVMLITIAGLTGCTNKAAQDTKLSEPLASVAIIDLVKAVQAHPQNQELLSLKRQYNTIADNLAAQAAAVPSSQLQSAAPGAASGLDNYIEQKYKMMMADKEREFNAALTAKHKELSERQAVELKEYATEIDQELTPPIFSLQLKMKTVQLNKEEYTKVQEELQKLQQDRIAKLTAKEQELAAAATKIMAQERKTAEQKLAQYSEQIGQQLKQQAADKANEMTVPQPLKLSGASEKQDEIAAIERSLTELRLKIEELERNIIEDVRSKAAKIAVDKGYSLVLANVKVNVSAVDITQDVIANFKAGR